METLSDLLLALNLTGFVSDNDFVWPVFEMLHFVGMALLIGSVGLLDLRILGFFKGIPINSLQKLIPLGIAGFVVNAVTGFFFIAGNVVGGPLEYLNNLAFQIKMLLIVLAAINLLVFHFTGMSRQADALPADGNATVAAKAVAATSIVFWLFVIVFGRLIMYNDTLLYALGM